MTDWETVTIRVDPETKGEWEEYAEEHEEVANLSHLVRYSVSQEMASETPATVRSSQPEDERIGEVLQEMRELSEQVNDVNTKVQSLQREKDATEKFDMQTLLLELLPVPQEEELRGKSQGEWGVTAEELASQIGAEDKSVILDPLERLEKNTGLVVSVSSGDTRVWWKSE